MSDIPFVNHLGDAIDAAITTPARNTRPLRRRLSSRAAVGLAALIAVSGGVALAASLLTFNTPLDLATANPMCFTSASLQDGTIGPSNNDLLPVPSCEQTRRELGQPPRPLVACVADHGPGGYAGVAVFPGAGPDACRRAGLKPLPAGYVHALTRAATLEHDLARLQPSVGCVAPAQLVTRVQTLLERSGWVGWHASLRSDPDEPCGSVTGLTDASATSARVSIDAPDREVDVFGEPYPSTLRLLHSREGTEALLTATGARCYSQTAIRRLVQDWLGHSARSVRYDVSMDHLTRAQRSVDAQASDDQPPDGGGLNHGRQHQLAAGCAVIAGILSAPDGYDLVVDVWQGD